MEYVVRRVQIPFLDYALGCVSEQGTLWAAQLLVEKGALDQYGIALRNAVFHGHLSIVQFLVKQMCYKSHHKRNAVRVAASCGHLSIIQDFEYQDVLTPELCDQAYTIASAARHDHIAVYLLSRSRDVE